MRSGRFPSFLDSPPLIGITEDLFWFACDFRISLFSAGFPVFLVFLLTCQVRPSFPISGLDVRFQIAGVYMPQNPQTASPQGFDGGPTAPLPASPSSFGVGFLGKKT